MLILDINFYIEKSLYVGISSPSISLQVACPDFMRWWYPFVVEWIKILLILNILHRKVSIKRKQMSFPWSVLLLNIGLDQSELSELNSIEFNWLNCKTVYLYSTDVISLSECLECKLIWPTLIKPSEKRISIVSFKIGSSPEWWIPMPRFNSGRTCSTYN